MKKLILILSLAALTGCATNPYVDTKVVTETKYIVRKATDQQKELPPYPPAVNVDTATQLELAEWIAANEERQYRLESLIKELISFFEKPVTEEEKK